MKDFQNKKYEQVIEEYQNDRIECKSVITEIESIMDDLMRNIDSLDVEEIDEFYKFVRKIADEAVAKQDIDVLLKCQTVTRCLGKIQGELKRYWQIMEKSVPLKECFGRAEAQSLIASIFETKEYEMPISILIKYAKKHSDFKIINECDKAIKEKRCEEINGEVNKYFESKVAQLIRDDIKPKGWPFTYASNKEWISFEKYAKNWKGKWK